MCLHSQFASPIAFWQRDMCIRVRPMERLDDVDSMHAVYDRELSACPWSSSVIVRR
jgi:hypothetical protein